LHFIALLVVSSFVFQVFDLMGLSLSIVHSGVDLMSYFVHQVHCWAHSLEKN
jgi:hypothetical protein